MTPVGSVHYESRSDDHSTAHVYVLSRVVSRLIGISVSLVGLTSRLKDKIAYIDLQYGPEGKHDLKK